MGQMTQPTVSKY